MQPGGEQWPACSAWRLGVSVEMREDDFMGEDRRPFKGGSTVGVSAALWASSFWKRFMGN